MRSWLSPLALALAFGCGGGAQSADTGTPGSGSESDSGGAEAGGETGATATEAEQVAAIEFAVNDTRSAVHRCYALAQVDDFRVEGEVVLEVALSAEGAASAVDVVSDSAGDARLTSCLVELWRAYRFPKVFAAGDRIRLPPFSFRAPAAQYTVRAADVEPVALGSSGSTAAILIDEQNSGNPAAGMTLLSMKSDVPLHRHTSAELLYVLSGSGVIKGVGARSSKQISAGTGVYIPAGAPHQYVHSGDAPLVALQLYAPAGPEQRFETPGAPGTEMLKGQYRWGKNTPKPQTRTVAEGEVLNIPRGSGELRLLFDEASTGDATAYLGVISFAADVTVPKHVHRTSTELIYLIKGEGILYIDDQPISIGPGTAIQIPEGVDHSFVGRGEARLEALQFYTPAGPEQRFKVKKP